MKYRIELQFNGKDMVWSSMARHLIRSIKLIPDLHPQDIEMRIGAQDRKDQIAIAGDGDYTMEAAQTEKPMTEYTAQSLIKTIEELTHVVRLLVVR